MSADTENKLARAAQSAQRLAQLSDVARDDSTLDLFAGDTSRAALEALSIDTRQGTLAGFELPDNGLAAVVRAPLAASAKLDGEPAPSGSGQPAVAQPAASATAAATMAAAARSVAPTRRQSAVSSAAGSGERAASAAEPAAKPQPDAAVTDASIAPQSPTSAAPASAAPSQPREASALQRPPLAPRRAPDLDRARATAFADTVDALYGVIADQRRAAGDHSRRMKWLLSIVVIALLVTVAIGIAQTMLLMRLNRESTTQQQRIEEMLRSQQATLATLLDTDSATASIPAIEPAPAAPTARQNAPAQPSAKRAKTKTQHARKPKGASSAH